MIACTQHSVMLPIESAWVFWGNTAPNVSLINGGHMTNEQELSHLWRHLTNTYCELQQTDSNSPQHRYLTHLAEMYRLEYRNLTSNYR